MRRLGHPTSHDTSANRRWLMTFTDLTALMLVFFVLLFSMSELDTDKWRSAVAAFNLRFNVQVSDESPRPQADENVSLTQPVAATDLSYLTALLQAQLPRHPALSQVRLVLWPDKLVISMPNQLLFRSSEAELQPSGIEALFALGGALGTIRNRVDVIGHSDPLPLRTRRFTSNWELSLARATAVVQALRAAGYSQQSRALGYGSSRFGEISTALPEVRRLELARRVDIIVREGRGER